MKKDRVPKVYVEWIGKEITCWLKHIPFLKSWTVECARDLKEEKSENEATDYTFFYAHVRHDYYTLIISPTPHSLKVWQEKRFDELHHGILHELCHAITEPLYDLAISKWVNKAEIEIAREQLTETIANQIEHLVNINKGGIMPKKKKKSKNKMARAC